MSSDAGCATGSMAAPRRGGEVLLDQRTPVRISVGALVVAAIGLVGYTLALYGWINGKFSGSQDRTDGVALRVTVIETERADTDRRVASNSERIGGLESERRNDVALLFQRIDSLRKDIGERFDRQDGKIDALRDRIGAAAAPGAGH